MRYFKYIAVMAVMLVLPFAYSQAQVRVGVGIGVGPAIVAAGPPVCAYGYYDYYPYACAPYGFYGPDYFVGGVFVGAGPWFHWGHPAGFWGRGPYVGRGFYGRPGFARRGPVGRGAVGHGAVGHGPEHSFHQAPVAHGGGFRGSAGFHGGRR